jgi:long-chain acyl-CoA synthetase
VYPGVHAVERPDKPAIIMGESGEVVTYRQLDEASNRVAQYLHGLGLRRGDGIALLLENHPRYLEVCWGAERSGLYYTAISTRLTPDEVAYIVEDSGAQAVITSRAYRDVMSDVQQRLPNVRAWLMMDGATTGFESYEDVIGGQPAEPLAEQPRGQDLLYSSGTTGKPKGIKPRLTEEPVETPSALLHLVQALYGMDEQTVYLSPAPLYHAAPLRYTMAVHRLGGTAVVMERFEPDAALELIERHGVTHGQFVPTMFVRLLRLPEEVRAKYDVSSIKAAVHAAAPCPVPIKEQMIDWWGPVVFEYYAGTEGNGFVAIDSHEWLEHKGSVGRALLGDIHIVDEDGNDLPPGEIGTVYFADGPQFEYHNAPEKTAGAYNAKGWSTLGDVGWVDEEGFLYLADRRSHLILSGGVNIYPAEIEAELIMHPEVVDVAVFGIPNEEFGEEVKAVVQPADMARAGAELERDLMDFCRSRLAGFKCPRSVDFLAELPRSRTGKLYKRELQDPYWERTSA